MIDWLDDYSAPEFPATSRTLDEPAGLLAAGGDVSPAWLDAAYRLGIFPWNDPEEVRMWWTPAPRAVITPETFRVPKRLAREVRNSTLTVTSNQAFERVVAGCASARAGSEGTWIDQELTDELPRLHRCGRAVSVECWTPDGELVGGFYGLTIGTAFFGESMFTRCAGASKIAFATAAPDLFALGIELIDCQMKTDHLARFGLIELDRPEFESALAACIAKPAIAPLPALIRDGSKAGGQV